MNIRCDIFKGGNNNKFGRGHCNRSCSWCRPTVMHAFKLYGMAETLLEKWSLGDSSYQRLETQETRSSVFSESDLEKNHDLLVSYLKISRSPLLYVHVIQARVMCCYFISTSKTSAHGKYHSISIRRDIFKGGNNNKFGRGHCNRSAAMHAFKLCGVAETLLEKSSLGDSSYQRLERQETRSSVFSDLEKNHDLLVSYLKISRSPLPYVHVIQARVYVLLFYLF